MQPRDTRLKRLDKLADLLDDSIRIPVIGYRIGYDAVIGLIPGLGDAASLLMSTYIVVEAARFHLPKSTVMRMIANVGIEAIIGAVPLLGDVFDAVYKANLRNLRLLKTRLDHTEEKPRDDRLFIAAVILVPIVAILLIVAAVIWLLVTIL